MCLLARAKFVVLLMNKPSKGQVVCDLEEKKLWTMSWACLHMGTKVTSELSHGQVPSLLQLDWVPVFLWNSCPFMLR